MTSNYSMLYDTVKRLLHDSFQIDVTIKETHGARLAPWTDIITRNGKKEYVIYYNPRIEIMLALFNCHMLKSKDCTKALIEFLLYHSYMQQDDYEKAQAHLDAFHSQAREMGMNDLPDEIRNTDKGFMAVQVMFILLHEASHISISGMESVKAEEMNISRKVLTDMKTTMNYGFDGSGTEDALLKDPHIMSVIEAAIPDELTGEEREEGKKKLIKDFSKGMNYPPAIERMLKENDVDFMEEMACDRMAWVNIMAQEKNMGADEEIIYSIHLMLYIALNAVDFIKAQQLTYSPKEHAKNEYNMQRITLRHMAFTDLLWLTSENMGDYNTDAHNDITLQFQSIGILANQSLGSAMEDLYRLYGNDKNDNVDLDIAALNRIESNLEEIAAEIM